MGFGLKRPPDGADANLVLGRQLRDRLALTVQLGNYPLLTSIKTLRAPKLLTLAFGPLDPRVGTAADQAAPAAIGVTACRCRGSKLLAIGRDRNRLTGDQAPPDSIFTRR